MNGWRRRRVDRVNFIATARPPQVGWPSGDPRTLNALFEATGSSGRSRSGRRWSSARDARSVRHRPTTPPIVRAGW